MTSSVVQSNASNSAVVNPTVTLGAAPTPGNTLVAWVSSDTTHTAVPTAGAGNSFTQRISQVNNQGFYVWTRLVGATDSATITFTASSALNTSAQVIEVQGTYDKIGTGTSTINTAGTTRDTTTLTPANADNTVLALAGIHGFQGTGSGGSADNTFTLTRANFPGGTGTSTAGTVSVQRFTGSTAATGTTTVSWTGNAIDRDGVQIAFAGIAGGGAAAIPPIYMMAPLRR